MGRFSFGKREKLCSKTVIERLFSVGKSFKAYPLRVYLLPVEKADAAAQVLISVPKKRVRSSPARNRIKRLIRETYRLNKPDLLEEWEEGDRFFAIGFVYIGTSPPEFGELNNSMKTTIEQLRLVGHEGRS